MFVAALGMTTFFFGECWSCLTQANHTDYNFLLLSIALFLTWWVLFSVLRETGLKGEQMKLAGIAGVFCGVLMYIFLRKIAEHILDLGLERSYEPFRAEATQWLRGQNVEKFSVPASSMWVYAILSLWSLFWVMISLWPKMRYIKSYQQITELNSSVPRSRHLCPMEAVIIFCCKADFFFPFILCLMWVPSVTQVLLHTHTHTHTTFFVSLFFLSFFLSLFFFLSPSFSFLMFLLSLSRSLFCFSFS